MKRGVLLALLVVGCGGSATVSPPPKAPPPPPPPPAGTASAPADPLGPRPEPTMAPPFEPPAPTVYVTASGMTVWLLERHALPLVAASITVPTGAASDPPGKAGLARMAADMMDEGAGSRGAVEFSRAVQDLGARLSTGASADRSFAGLLVTKRGFDAGIRLLADAVIAPRFEAKEWKRVHDLWMNSLKQRQTQPEDVARVVSAATLYGPDAPYGHPTDGLLSSAPKVTLEDARKLREAAWRPDRAVLVVVGDVTRAELDTQLDAAFGRWKAPRTAPLPIVVPPGPAVDGSRPKLVMVDRPDSPQSVIVAVRPGVAASDPREPLLERANIALGGSFDSRLMQDLREKRGWTYGVGSSVQAMRGIGSVVEGGSFVTDRTVDALKQMLADASSFAHGGLTDDEVGKTRLKARADLVDQYESVEHVAMVLSHDASLGLGADWEARAATMADRADKPALDAVVSALLDPGPASVVVVGARASLGGPLEAAGWGPVLFVDAEGNPEAKRGADGREGPGAPQMKGQGAP